MSIYAEIGLCYLAAMIVFGGFGYCMGKAAQREESDRASLSRTPPRPRVVQTSAHRARPAQVHDLSSLGRALASARAAQRGTRPTWDGASPATRAEGFIGGDAA